MQEPGSNEELFSLIIVSNCPNSILLISTCLVKDSMMDWDDKMQKECALSFI